MLQLSARRWDVLVLLLLSSIGLALFAPIAALRPLDGDNLYVLAWVHSAPFTNLLGVDPAIYPEWRPLAYLSVWLEYRVVPLEWSGLHLLVNLALWVLSAFLIYRIVLVLTEQRAAAFGAGLLLFVDRRAEEALTWIVERQMLLALLLGLVAFYVVTRARERDVTRRESVVIAALLLGSALGKEYGLAFALAIGLHAAWVRRVHLLVAPVAACTVYVTLRLAVAGGAVAPYCEDMGFLFSSSYHCIDLRSYDGILQVGYNAAASTVGTMLSGVFDSDGMIGINRPRLLIALVFAGFAAIGLLRGPAVLQSVALLPFATGALSVMLFRPRNLLIGVAGMAILAGVGMASVQLRLASARLRPQALAAMAAVILALLSAKASMATEAVAGSVDSLIARDPCDDENRERPFMASFVRVVRETYEFGDPDCRWTAETDSSSDQ
jgi:hypothetical protein